MITTTLGELADAKPGLIGILGLPLSAKASFHVAKLARKVMPDVQSFHEQLNALIKKYGTPVPDSPNQFSFSPDKVDGYNAEMKELRAVEVKIDSTPITMAMIEGHNVEGQHLLALGPLFVEE